MTDDVLHVVFTDARLPGVGWRTGYAGLSHANPPEQLSRVSVGTDDPLPNGIYVMTGRQLDNHWVYEHRDDGTPTR